MKYFINLIILIIYFGCSVSRNEAESEEAGFITPTVLNNYDTIKNGQIFKAKVFFENSYLFEEARKNGIKDYYSLTYETNVDGETVFSPSLLKLQTLLMIPHM
ncbi:MAG: hypothetical protein AAF519_16945 [Bacteroidota bacterium]